jgi:hypothetical protein
MNEVRRRVSPSAPVEGALLRILFGDRQEVRKDGASCVVELGGFESTNFGEVMVTLD